MSKTSIEILAEELRRDPDYLKKFNEMAALAVELGPLLEKLRTAKIGPQSDEPEFRIVEQGAIPAAYYYRDSVQAAILEEIKRDYKINGENVPGVELINGTTEKTSDSENDITVGGDGSQPSPDSENNGTENGSRGTSDPGRKSKDDSKTGTGEKTSGKA